MALNSQYVLVKAVYKSWVAPIEATAMYHKPELLTNRQLLYYTIFPVHLFSRSTRSNYGRILAGELTYLDAL